VLLAALAASAAAGCGEARVGSSHSIVPWVDRPLPLYVTPQPKLVHYPTSAPRCRASQLRVRRGRTGVATGNALEELVFTNVSSTPCLLRGSPSVSGVPPGGSRVALRPRLGGTFFGRLVPSDLAPGGHVFLEFGTSDCGCRCERSNPVRYRDLVFALPHGDLVQGGTVTLTKDCFLDMSGFGLPERYSQPHTRPGTPGTLRVRVHLPEAVRAGAPFRYVVTLRNPTATTVSFTRCPGYTQGLFTERAATHRSFELNCDSVRSIPPHGRVRYEMRLIVPPRAREFAKFGWSLNTPTGPFAGGAIRIDG